MYYYVEELLEKGGEGLIKNIRFPNIETKDIKIFF
jgi:hypothetical protein